MDIKNDSVDIPHYNDICIVMESHVLGPFIIIIFTSVHNLRGGSKGTLYTLFLNGKVMILLGYHLGFIIFVRVYSLGGW